MALDSLTYRLVFDVMEVGYRIWWFPSIGALVAALGIAWTLWLRKTREVRTGWETRALPPLITGFAVVWAALAFALTYPEYATMRRALSSRHYLVVEGPVTEFKPGDAGDHVPETFVVAGHRFSYTASEITAGYNRTTHHGGVIREGTRVRIASVLGKIARLEVAN